MTIPPIERDETGRFVKPPEGEKPILHDNENVHPMSKLLFGWVESPRTPTILLLLVILLGAALIVLDTMVERHDYFKFAEAAWFYSAWGFGSFALAVLSGWPLGKLLRRDEDYYGEADTKPDDIDPEAKL